MSRQIKFRAWIPSEKAMIQHREVIERAHMQFEDRLDCSDIVMQYTGLKDQKGVEIFEGDFLQFATKREHGFPIDGKLITIGPVEFGRFFAKDDVLYEYIGFHINGKSIHYKLLGGCTIIGNIHQNPELL